VPASLHVLLRGFPVLHRPGRARTSRTRTPAALRFASLRRVTGSLQALSDTPSAVSIARPPPHPSHADACCGAFGQKNPPRPRRSIGDPNQALFKRPDNALSCLFVLLRGRVRVFAAIAPLHAIAVQRGAGDGAVKNAARGAFFRACEGSWPGAAEQSEARQAWRRGCETVRDVASTEKPEQHVHEVHGRRPAIKTIFCI